MREKLIELLTDLDMLSSGKTRKQDIERRADYLIANGVVVLLRDGNDFNPDVYCPYCGNNLSSVWEEEQNG